MPIDIRGKQYRTVAERVADFRELCPARDGWGLTAEVLHADDQGVRMVARIIAPSGVVVAEGHAEETRTGTINSTSALENCETSAWGRALAAFGFAGDEIASADELRLALGAQARKRAESIHQREADDEAEWRKQVEATGATWRAWCEWTKAHRKPSTPPRNAWSNARAWLEDNAAEVAAHEPTNQAAK